MIRVDSAFEAVGGIGSEEKAPGSTTNIRGREVSRLEENVDGGVSHPTIQSTHHAGEGERSARLVGDDAVDVLKVMGFLVEGLELLAMVGLTDVKWSADLGSVEGVKWLAEFVENVVGNIDDVIDGAETDGFEFFGEPVGAWGYFDAFDRKDGVEGADRGVDGDSGGVFVCPGGVALRDRFGFGVK